MRRRSFLRRGLAVGALPPLADGFAGRAAAGRLQPPERRARSADRSRQAGTDGPFAPLARTAVPEAKEAAVTADGRTAFLAVTDGFAVVDLSEPYAPTVVYEDREPWAGAGNGRLELVYDVKLDRANDLLAVVGPAQPDRSFHGLVVYDVADPTDPERVSAHGTQFFNHNCDIADGYAYLAAGREGRHALVVVDARTGEEVGRWSIADHDPDWTDVPAPNWVLHDVHVRDGLAYLAQWDAGTWVVDVSDPAAPSFVATVGGRPPAAFTDLSRGEARDESLQPPGNDHVTETDEAGTLLAVGVESWDADASDDVGGPGGVTLYDVSDPAAPAKRAVIDPPPTPDPTFGGTWTTAHNLDLRGDRLYTAWYAGGVTVHDVSDPANPVELAAWRDDETTSFWTAQGATDDAFLAVSRKGPTDAGRVASPGARVFTFPVPEERLSTPTRTATETAPPTETPTPAATGTATPTRPPTDTPGTPRTTGTPGTPATDGHGAGNRERTGRHRGGCRRPRLRPAGGAGRPRRRRLVRAPRGAGLTANLPDDRLDDAIEPEKWNQPTTRVACEKFGARDVGRDPSALRGAPSCGYGGPPSA